MTTPGSARDSARRALISGAAVAALLVTLLFLWHARQVLLIVFAGILFGIFLRRLATIVSRYSPLSTAAALPVVIIGLVGLLVAAVWLRGASIAAEAGRLGEELPKAMETVRTQLSGHELGQRIVQELPDDPSALLPDEPDAVQQVTGVLSRSFSVLATFALILFLGIVFAATPNVYVNGILALFPKHRVPRMREVVSRASDALWWWLIGRLITMTFIGVATGVGLALLGVPLPFILGLLAALLSFIPNLGPILSAIPAILLAFVQGPQTALWVAGLYAAVQVVESYVLDPIVDRKTIYLPPALTITAQLVMGVFCGLLGVTLATPLAAALVVVITMVYVQDVLGRKDVRVRSH